jgi:hypothetical protein
VNSSSELWYVQLSDGDVHRVTLHQLDEGFQAGHIDASTMVLSAGATSWTKLGELAGMDDVVSAVRSPASLPQPVPVALPAPPAVLPQLPAAASVPLIESHRPVSVDLSDLDVVPGLPRKSRKRWLIAALVVAMIGGLAGVGVERPSVLRHYLDGARSRVVAAKVWMAAALPRKLGAPPAEASVSPVESPLQQPPPTPAPAPSAQSTAEEGLPASSASDQPLTQKPAAHGLGPKAHPRKPHTKVGASSDSPSRASATFTPGGSKFDPLSSPIQ